MLRKPPTRFLLHFLLMMKYARFCVPFSFTISVSVDCDFSGNFCNRKAYIHISGKRATHGQLSQILSFQSMRLLGNSSHQAKGFPLKDLSKLVLCVKQRPRTLPQWWRSYHCMRPWVQGPPPSSCINRNKLQQGHFLYTSNVTTAQIKMSF